MATSEFPKVKIDLSEIGRGKIEIDGVEMRSVERVSFEAVARDLTRVTLTLCAGIEITAQEAEVIFLNAPEPPASSHSLPGVPTTDAA